MATILTRVQHASHRSRKRIERRSQRLDIQGLRMIAVLLVFAFHICGWPRGGFIGVDVFFVISGFLITGNLLRTAETRGNVSFSQFYWNRVRRIVPAATVVLVLTYLASVLVFMPFRASQIGVDAVFAFVFMSNWRFGTQGTDYFAASDAVSPIQHYWSLSIEEQFYFVWPALIFLIGLVVVRRAWTPRGRMGLAAAVMAGVVTVSLGWAVYETATSPAWAYFNTFTRVWELGVGALLATAAGLLGRISTCVKPWLSWAGLGLVAAGAVLIGEGSSGFPAPWALLPVAGSALVIAAGVDGEPAQGLLRNPVSVYLGNISYSLYLVHWPVIVIVGALMPRDPIFYLVSIALTLALSIASYHFIENPFRRIDWRTARSAVRDMRRHRFRLRESSRHATIAVLALLSVALTAYAIRPTGHVTEAPPVTAGPLTAQQADLGPLASALQQQIAAALSATEWPALNPSMESGFKEKWPQEINVCAGTAPPTEQDCTWGSPSAPTRIAVVGDSVAMHYANALRLLALNSDNQIQVHVDALGGCPFVDAEVFTPDHELIEACPGRKKQAVDYINTQHPTLVIISNQYVPYRRVGVEQAMTSNEWFDASRQMVAKIRNNGTKIVWLSAPPMDVDIKRCYGNRSSVPADCITRVTGQWLSMASTEQRLAETVAGVWLDSRPWFCSTDGRCPSFVGSTPTKHDNVHMTKAYEELVYPVIGESLRAAGLI